ncbi:NADH dehydrogenase subunit 2 (mitochondrion) [Varroa destructor]|nr:NADH dehydrogenase subunit 2 [Varroa destructor]BBI76484.1 NADH dehydrogenase subunit 2 [Varroa destructor]CAD37993.1 NADH dehydrogenase subunit 2 [Varroa destructor]
MKLLSIVLLVMVSLMSFSVESWFFLWVMLEFNLLFFMFYIFEKNNLVINSMMKYFIIQSFLSMLLLFFLVLSNMVLSSSLNMMLISWIMFMKMGLFPFHFWLVDVGEGLSWMGFIVFLTLQKLIPLYILSLMEIYYLEFIVVMNNLMGVVMMYNQNSLRKVLVYSSMVHLTWIIMLLNLNSSYWFIYFFIYLINIMMLKMVMKNMEVNNFIQLKYLPIGMKMGLMMIFLSLSGMPPFMGFISKMTVLLMYFENQKMIFLIMLLVSVMSMYIYMNYFMKSLFFMSLGYNKNKNMGMSSSIMLLVLPFFIFLYSII